MKNRLIIIGLIFSILFQTFGIQANDILIKKSDKASFHTNKKAENSNLLKSLFIEEETEETVDDESDSTHKVFSTTSLSHFILFIIAENEPIFRKTKNYSNTFSIPIFLVFRNLRI